MAVFGGFCRVALFGVLFSGAALANDLPLLTDAEFRTFTFDELDLRSPAQGSADVSAATSVKAISGYPLSAEELNLVIETPQPIAGFRRASLESDYTAESTKQPFRVRLMGWIKQRSSDFNLFKLFSADDSAPGMRLDVDTEQEELVLEYHIGF